MSAVNIAGLTQTEGVPNRFHLRCANPECPSVVLKNNVGMDVEGVEGKKVRFTVPCILCGGTHTADVSADLLESKEIFMLQCPNYGADICFTGELKNVKYELSRSELELLNMMSDGENADISLAPDKSRAVPDPEISEKIIGTIKCLEDENRVYCKCVSYELGFDRFEISLEPECVCVRCLKCGAEKKIPAISNLAADDFIMTDSLTLE